MVTRLCENCKSEFQTKNMSNPRRGRFCSKSCAASGIHNSSYRHGEAVRHKMTKEYRTWVGIRKRVTDETAQNYKYYGGRGITMAERWLTSFENFLEDMGRAPTSKHSIDRIDHNGNYTPENCRWATTVEQMSNTRSNKLITYKGVTMTQEQWGRKTGIGGTNICKRLKRGWTVEKALTMARG